MAFAVVGGSSHGGAVQIISGDAVRSFKTHLPLRRHLLFTPNPSPSLPLSERASHVASAKRFSSRTGKPDSKNNRRSATTTKEEDEDEEMKRVDERESRYLGGVDTKFAVDGADEDFPFRDLPGEKTDFWEGPQWDALGFFVQYMWAFGIVFALIACGIAVATYNEGATDFKKTPAYKESIESQELLEEPEGSNSDVFESNPTEAAPSLQ